MKIKMLIVVLATAIGFISCSNDDEVLNSGQDSFVYIETLVFDDYSGDSKLLIVNGNRTTPIQISNGNIQYQIVDSKIIYRDGFNIVEFNPITNQTQVIASLPNIQINGFHLSPDNKYLAYSDYEDVLLLEVESGATTNLTANLEGDFRFPKWSPDGNSILIINGIPKTREGDVAPTATANFKIYSLSQKSFQDVEMYDEFAYPSHPEWSPNSDKVVYEQYGAVFIFDVHAQQLKRITSEVIVATNPSFSTDGRMLSYFSSNLSGNGDNWQNFLTLYHIGSGKSEIINNVYSYDVSWNNDSSEILYCTGSGIFSYNLNSGSNIKIVYGTGSTFLHSVEFLNLNH